MKKLLILLLLLVVNAFYAQDKLKHKWLTIDYLNMTGLSVTKNTSSYFLRDSIDKKNGGALEINTIQGIVICKYVGISAGISLDWNINKTFLSTPAVIDLRCFSNKDRENCLYAFIQTGKNIKWSSSFNGNGSTAKLGVGTIFQYDEDYAMYVELYKKSKQINLINSGHTDMYSVDGFGLSIGLTFKL